MFPPFSSGLFVRLIRCGKRCGDGILPDGSGRVEAVDIDRDRHLIRSLLRIAAHVGDDADAGRGDPRRVSRSGADGDLHLLGQARSLEFFLVNADKYNVCRAERLDLLALDGDPDGDRLLAGDVLGIVRDQNGAFDRFVVARQRGQIDGLKLD